MPCLATRKALWLVDTEHLTTLKTSPFLVLAPYKPPYSEFLYVRQVLNHAHSILRSIALVQMFKGLAGELVATEAELDSWSFELAAILDAATNAGL
jgi:hypothetical protein